MSGGVTNTMGCRQGKRWGLIVLWFLMAAVGQLWLWNRFEPLYVVELRNESVGSVGAVGTIFHVGRAPVPFRVQVYPNSAFTDPHLYLAPGDRLTVKYREPGSGATQSVMLSYLQAANLVYPATRIAVVVRPRFDPWVRELFPNDDDELEGPPLNAAFTPIRLVLMAGLFGWTVTLSYRPWLLGRR